MVKARQGIVKSTIMNYNNESKDFIINDLLKLQQSFNALKEQSEKDGFLIKELENELRKSEEKCRVAFMTSPDSVNITRLSDGMYVFVNDRFTKILGYSEEEAIGKTSLELDIWTNPEDRGALIKQLRENGKVDNFSAIFRRKDGSLVNGLMTASLIDIDGVPHILNVTRDVTLALKTEEALEQEQMIIDALMNNLPDHIYFKDRQSRFIRNNKAHARSFGLDDPDQAIGRSDFDFFTEDAARKAFDDEQKIIETGQPVFKEEKLTRKDNTVVWFHAMKMPLFNNNGNIIGTFGISRDITKQKYAEETLKHSEERFRSVTHSANDAIITIDFDGNILGWNRGAENIFGYKETEIIGESLNIIIPEDYVKQHIKNKILLERRRPEYNKYKPVELAGMRKNGDFFPIELSLSEWETSEGKFYTGIVRDITSRKRTELENQIIYEITQGVTSTSNLDELLKLIHHSLGKAVNADNFFVALYNDDSGLFSFPYFVDKYDKTPLPTLMGKSCTAYVFRTLKPFLFSEEEYNRLLENDEVELIGSASPSWIGIPLQTPAKVIGVMVLQHYEKADVYTENDVKLLMSIGSQIAIAIERKKAEEEILLKNELLQAINAEKDKFFSILAHDLRGPLSAFVAATQILTEEIQSMNLEEIREISVSMKESATNIYSLLENLLEWSRLQRGVMDFVPEKFNIRREIKECIDVLSESARKKEIVINFSIPPDLDIIADKHMFDTVTRNLVSNAIKFTPTGGNIQVEVLTNTNNETEIHITDSGIGMTAELKNKLFHINEKTSREGTDGEPSTGLGLLLCKEFVEKHDGKIWAESEAGQGSTFYFTIPVVESSM
jgi:PAS domain S-box-containing protein